MYLIKNKDVVIAESSLVVGEKAMIANNTISKHTIVFLYQDSATEKRTRTSIQVAIDKHVEPGDFGAFANHSCEPNCQIIANYDETTNIATVLMLTINDVQSGEELTFDYATTETEVTDELHNVRCLCKTKKCRGKITGFIELPLSEKMRLFGEDITANYLQIVD